jgi:O-antigen/teichoic acid export membrane protein
MGKALYGTFLSFQSLATLGGLGDLGMGGALNIETSRLLGKNDIPALQRFLAVARTAFAGMAVFVVILFICLAPWLPQWLHFQPTDKTGSMTLLFIVGGIAAGFMIINSYITNVNYGAVTLTWPIIPTFLSLQLSLLAHWLVALAGPPLWIQYLPYIGATALLIGFGWMFLRRSHPQLSAVLAMRFDRTTVVDIIGKSFWVYLYCIGGSIFTLTDRLIINAAFGAEQVPPFQLNMKLAELALFVIGTASIVSTPKIAVWVASPDAETRQRGAAETLRLSRFQTFLGCAAVLVYLVINDPFMHWWLGPEFHVPLAWQAAFAGNLGVMAVGYAGYYLAPRCGTHGLRFGALAVAAGVLTKVALSCLAIVYQSIFIIAWSTVVAQSLIVLVSAWHVHRTIGTSWWKLAGVGWLLSLGLIAFATFWKASLWDRGVSGKAGFAVAAILLMWLTAKIIGLSATDLKAEVATARAMLRR